MIDSLPPLQLSELREEIALKRDWAEDYRIAEERRAKGMSSPADSGSDSQKKPRTWGIYKEKELTSSANSAWELVFNGTKIPALPEWVRQRMKEFQTSRPEHKFAMAELGSPGGLTRDYIMSYGDKLGKKIVLSLGDGRSADTKQFHALHNVKFLTGDLSYREVTQKISQAAPDGLDFIFCRFVGGWSSSIPNNPFFHALMLQRLTKLLAPRGVLLSDYTAPEKTDPRNYVRVLEERMAHRLGFPVEVKAASSFIAVVRSK